MPSLLNFVVWSFNPQSSPPSLRCLSAEHQSPESNFQLQKAANVLMKSAGGQNPNDTLDLAFQISNVLDCGLDRHTLSLIIALLDRGINPEPLSALIRELSSSASQSQTSNSSSAAKP
ncbi:mitotic-spindle organizing protein 1-like [Phalaenopsis equestris]|uniref:mitotic-spindle organizing protein 1-like n=1 Tax=Phalaenopsis equestris TaxID=78828 RepID=UPI0009E35DC3|nr:mitotic-spindle organizing protein 1-like [Phalaenopsis equestris]